MNKETTTTTNVSDILKLKLLDRIKKLIKDKDILSNLVKDESISDLDLKDNQAQVENSIFALSRLLNTSKMKKISFTPEEISNIGFNPIEKVEEEINKPILSRTPPIFKLNYNYDIVFINLRDIRFSQPSISSPFKNDIEETISSSMNNYPFKFYNYNKNNLVLLGMFGENDYSQSDKIITSYPPTVPSLNVVKFEDTNCYVSIDNRRIELIYRQLCLLLSIDPKMCTIDNMMFKNTNDFLRFELGIPDDVYIYIPCCVKNSYDKPSRKMKTPSGVQLERLNKSLGSSELDKIEPTYAGVIWQRITGESIQKYRDTPLNGLQSFPSIPSTNEKLNSKTNIPLYKNKYYCRKNDTNITKGPINISSIINNLAQSKTIEPLGTIIITEKEYKNIQKLYYYVANIFINYLVDETLEFKEYISYDNLFNNSIKFIPDFEEWKINIDKIPLYPEVVGGKKTRKRCKNGYRKNPKTKRCNKKTNTSKKPHFRIGVDFGGVLARQDPKDNQENAPITEHKRTKINMPGAVETLHKLKDKGHTLYIVSFCGKKRALEAIEEIKNKNLDTVFTEQIYIGNPYEKSTVLAKFGCNFMIDDRLDLLNFIQKRNPAVKTIWFGHTEDECKNTNHICAETWDDVYKIINNFKAFNVPKQNVSFDKYLAIKPKKTE